MNEEEWLTCPDLDRFRVFLCGKTSKRKARLWTCGIARSVWHLLRDPRSREAVEVAEAYCDGAVGLDVLRRAGQAADSAFLAVEESFCHSYAAARGEMRKHIKEALPFVPAAQIAAWATAENLDLFQGTDFSIDWGGGPEYETAGMYLCHEAFDGLVRSQCHLIRELFGNPFRASPLDPSWLAWADGLVPKLARSIYFDRAFDRMPILGDALEDSGCTNQTMIDHCHQPGLHARGCWLVDLLLGQS